MVIGHFPKRPKQKSSISYLLSVFPDNSNCIKYLFPILNPAKYRNKEVQNILIMSELLYNIMNNRLYFPMSLPSDTLLVKAFSPDQPDRTCICTSTGIWVPMIDH